MIASRCFEEHQKLVKKSLEDQTEALTESQVEEKTSCRDEEQGADGEDFT